MDRKRHKLLELLSEQRKKIETNPDEPNLAVDFTTLCKELKCDREFLYLIYTDLIEKGEVGFYNATFEGLYAERKGVASFVTKKYLKDRKNRTWTVYKNWVQTLIPVLSLLATIFIAYDKTNESSSLDSQELQVLKKEINYLKQSLNSNEAKTRIQMTSAENKVKTDSLKKID